ncbi:myocardin-related transcription factor A-like [Pempheris klunzingeri]|uniref:myocardin-related transcription factor A-like n=1 Tax=Pempheris klunzingeri TaxID=3127111 RepID=UPI00397FD0B1
MRSVYEPRSESPVTMETKFGERPNTDASIWGCHPSPQSEAVANELSELSLQPDPNLLPSAMLEHLPCVRIDPAPLRPPPISRNMDETAIRFELKRQACQSLRQVLQLKLQQRRSREELVNQGIMPPLKSSAAFHEQRRSLERARTEDYLKRKIKCRPEQSELIRMHILEDTSAEPSLQAKQLQLKRARLADDLNDKISHRPGPMELIHKNILPVNSSIKQAIIETTFPKVSGDNSSCDEDSNYSLSPEQPVSQGSPLDLLPLPSPPETLAGSRIPSPSQPKPNSDRSAQRHKKPKDNKPKIKKLKYHQYIPPDQKGDKEPPPHLDSSYAKILQQQQLFLQLQILNQQQQQHYNYHAILPAPPKPQTDQQPSSTSSSNSTTTTSSPPRPVDTTSTAPSDQCSHSGLTFAPSGGTKPASVPPNLDEMKVAELKSELKLRSLPVSGTKNDLIERLRTYQELNGGCDTTSSPTAGGTTGPGAERAEKSSNSAATATNNNNNTSQQQQQFQFQCRQTSSLTAQSADAGSSATPATTVSQQLINCCGNVSPPAVSLTPSDRSACAVSPEDTSLNGDPLGEMMSSPLTQQSLQPRSAAQPPVNIKDEPKCPTPAPCQFSLKPASLQKHRQVSSAAPTTTNTSVVVTMDKDKMLQEKDKQIEELTRMLRQKQRLVEVLRMQLEHGKKGRAPEPLVFVRVKQEPPDKPCVSDSLAPPPSSVSCEMDVTKVTVKQEAIEAEEVASETAMRLPDADESTSPSTQTQEAEFKPGQMNMHVCLQQTTLHLAQQQAIQKLLLQQQHNIQNQQQTIQMPENQQNLQKPSQHRKRKSHKQQLKQQQQLLQSQQQQHQVSQQQQQQQQHQQQMHLKQQILLKQQKLFSQQQNKQQQTKQLQQIQVQTKIHLKQQQVLIQQKQQAQQKSPQVSQAYLSQQSGSASSFPLDVLKSNSTPTLVTDSNGNHFLIALTSHFAENQRTDAPGSKETNQITLQRMQSTPAKLPGNNPVQLPKADNQAKQSLHVGFLKQQKTKAQNGGLEQLQHHVAQSLSAPPSLQPFFADQETAPSGRDALSPSAHFEVSPSLDVMLSPPSPVSIKTAASSPDNKDTEHEDDLIDIILQTGEMSTTFKPAPDPSLEHLNPNSSAPSAPPSPLQLLLSPPVPPSCDTPQPAHSVQSEPQIFAATPEEKQHLSNAGRGRLEDFLESTTGKPLLGVEPGGLLTLIDDLHSQMLCTPSILDHPPSPIDTFDMEAEGEHGLDSMDWLDLTMGGVRVEETPTLAPLGPPSVFSTDFLDSFDLQEHCDSYL